VIKTLSPIGNSLGLVIDKSLLDVMEIDRTTPLRVQVFGRRLVIEPLESEGADAPAAHDQGGVDLRKPAATLPILDELVARGMGNERFRRLHHADNYVNTIVAHRRYCGRPHAGDFAAGGTNERTARRLLACLDALRGGREWDDAIADALTRVPKP
jgi:antitoxin component of MazEF toxin-antitoxin module